MSNTGKTINELQTSIIQVKNELSTIKQLDEPIPEFINNTNLIRKNEYLTKELHKQSQLVSLCEEYLQQLEKLVLSTSTIKLQIKKLKSQVKSRKTPKKISKKKRKKPKKITRRRSKVKKIRSKSKKRRR